MWKLPTVEETAGFEEGLVLITCWIWDRSLNFSELLLLNLQNESKDSNSVFITIMRRSQWNNVHESTFVNFKPLKQGLVSVLE